MVAAWDRRRDVGERPRVLTATEHQARVVGGLAAFARLGWLVAPLPKEGPVSDVIYIGLTIVVFAALFLLVKGVERIER